MNGRTMAKAVLLFGVAAAVPVALGAAAGAGFAIFVVIKGGWCNAVGVGLVAGAILAAPVVAFAVFEVFVPSRTLKTLISAAVIGTLSFFVPHYGGWPFFAQLAAVMLPVVWVRSFWASAGAALAGGFVVLAGLYLFWSLRHQAGAAGFSDDIFVFYPFVIVILAAALTAGRALARAVFRTGAAEGERSAP